MTTKLVMAFAALFFLSAAGWQPTYAAPPLDACSLLTDAQVGSALGFSAKPGRTVPTDKTVCDWPVASLAKMTSKDAKEIEINILNADSWALVRPAWRPARGSKESATMPSTKEATVS